MDMNALKPLLKAVGDMIKPMDELLAVKLSTPEALEELDKHLKKSMSRDSVQLMGVLADLAVAVNAMRAERVASFTPILSEYLRTRQSQGDGVRETGTGWRIGIFELQSKPGAGAARIAYNREPLTKWVDIHSVDSLTRLEQVAHSELSRWSIPDDDLLSILHSAYDACRAFTKSPLVPMVEFYKSVRYVQVKKLLDKEGPRAEITSCKLPGAAFMYAVDRYKALSMDLPPTKRLGFQTGSSHEVSQKKGFIINGLDPSSDYKVVCYVVRAE